MSDDDPVSNKNPEFFFRFRKPEKVSPWEGVLDGTKMPNTCVQVKLFRYCIHCTMGKLQWEVGHRNFSLLREKYIWNIWTRIKWEAKLTNLPELSERS